MSSISRKPRFPDFPRRLMMHDMNQENGHRYHRTLRNRLRLPIFSACLLWLAQPPFSLWPLAFFGLVPLFLLVVNHNAPRKQDWIALWVGALIFWLTSLQGLRHAHSFMFLGWMALSGYLAIYWVLFVFAARWMHQERKVPLSIAVAIAWIGQEYLRNHLLTGLSACMLGHTMAPVPLAMQIGSWFGSYGVSLFVVGINLLCYQTITSTVLSKKLNRLACCVPMLVKRDELTIQRNAVTDWILPIAWTTVVLVVGVWKIESSSLSPNESLGRYLLVQRSEPVEYVQSTSRAIEIYQSYAKETLDSLGQCKKPIDAVIWPESMYSAGNPWMEIHQQTDDKKIYGSPSSISSSAAATGLTPHDLRRAVAESRAYFQNRSAMLIEAAKAVAPNSDPIQFLVGCGVVRYANQPEPYCGLVQFAEGGVVKQWYGKNHLVMFGEYIPIISSLPFLKSLLPPGMGLEPGQPPEPMRIGDAALLPNICIETAVEHVAVNHLRHLRDQGKTADALITVTNDGWFKQSSVLEHHLRCAQFVSVAIGRPILSAANDGPTVWIDSNGRIKERLDFGSHGHLIAEPTRSAGYTFYTRLGEWPAVVFALITCLPIAIRLKQLATSDRRKRKEVSGQTNPAA